MCIHVHEVWACENASGVEDTYCCGGVPCCHMIMYVISCDHTPLVEVRAFEQKSVVEVLRTNNVNLLVDCALGDCDG